MKLEKEHNTSMNIRKTLSALNITPSKSKGQNFLVDDYALKSIVDFGAPKPDETIVEIGPGLGAMTRLLLQNGPVTAIELDKELAKYFRGENLQDLTLIEQDARTVNFSEIANGKKLVIFGNLPYSVSTDLIFHILENSKSITRAVFLLQKEYVERMCAAPGSKTFGVLSVSCQSQATLVPGPVINPECFYPVPAVYSQVVEIKIPDAPLYNIQDRVWFMKVVRAAFGQKRKMISNSLRSLKGLLPNWREGIIEEALDKVGITATDRAERVAIEKFVKLADEFIKI